MEGKLEQILQKNKYLAPIVEIYRLEAHKDVLCMSNESNDNEFDAGELGNF